MKIKVSPFTKKLGKEYASVIAFISALASLYFINVEISADQRNEYTVITTAVIVGLYLILWIKANLKQQAKLNINNSALIVKVGDIFEEKGLKAIAFNEYFDTTVDDVLISSTSLNGEYLRKSDSDHIKSLDERIAIDTRLSDRQVGINSERRAGKKMKYKLGSIFVDGEYLLTAFTYFDINNRAVLTLKDYVSCMLNFWNEVDQVYAGRSVALPLLGSGITRFKDAEVQPQELLNIIIWTFKISRVKFKHPANATVIIHPSVENKINFYEIDN